jgi:hypothetical protein
MPDANLGEVSAAILEYLVKNPDGMDTLRGIARFWIAKREIEIHVTSVERALAKLLNEGYIIEERRSATGGGGEESVYRLNPCSLREVLSQVESTGKHAHLKGRRE